MRCGARKLSAKWLSIEAVTAKRQRRRLERKRNRSEINRQTYRILPAAIQTDSSISRERITYDLKLKPVLILVSTGR